MIPASEKRVNFYQTANGDRPVEAWLRTFKNPVTLAKIAARITRLQGGLLGSCKSVGEGVHELKIDHGPGYRIYFANESDVIVLLLVGGAKKDQASCIAQAKENWRDHRDRTRKEKRNA